MEKKRKKSGRVKAKACIDTDDFVYDRNLRGSAALVPIIFRSILPEFVSSGTSVGFFVFFFSDLLGRKEGLYAKKKEEQVVGLESV